ncbi:MAG: hypothetical protein AB7G11_00560 [Phycisphaerales bacterium]
MFRMYAAGCAAVVMFAVAAGAQTYQFALTPQSTLSGSFSASAPFTGSFIGNYNATSNPGGTRTLLGAFGLCSSGNQVIPLSGTGSASGMPTSSPSGSFNISFSPGAAQATLNALSVDLLGGTEPTVATNISLTYQGFRTCQPTGFFPGLTIPLDLGSATVNALTASLTCSPATGTLSQTAPGVYAFSIPATITLGLAFTFNGAEQMADPTDVPITLTGIATLSGSSAAVTANLNVMQHQEIMGPIPALMDAPFDLPNPLGGTVHLLLTITLTSSTIDLTAAASLAADGMPSPAPCRADYNHDSFVNSQDFFDFLGALFAGSADFNCSGLTDSQDFFDFLTAFFSGCE